MNTRSPRAATSRTRAPPELDLEDHVVAARELASHLAAQRAVQVAAVFYPLQEVARRHGRAEGRLVMKWYSRPSTSPGRGARVVADTEVATWSRRCLTSPMTVPFPAPEGPEMTKTER